jgi:hypothetical protein
LQPTLQALQVQNDAKQLSESAAHKIVKIAKRFRENIVMI